MLDRLRAPEKDGGAGLTTGDIQKLIDQGIGSYELLACSVHCVGTLGTVEALAFAPTRHISSLKGVSEQKAERLKRAALSLVRAFCEISFIYTPRGVKIILYFFDYHIFLILQSAIKSCVKGI